MTTEELKAAQDAAQKAVDAAQAAKNLADAQEASFLGSVTKLSEIKQGRTQFQANRLCSRYISLFGFEKWQALVRDSR